MSNEVREKRDLVLPPGSYAYMQDTTKGVIKTYTGPTVINPTAQEVPVVYDSVKKTFARAASLEDAQRVSPIAPEGTYIVLHAPSKSENKHPSEGTAQPSDDLRTGSKIVVPGPTTFALWPGQVAEVVNGHHLRSNQYLLVRVYNEDEARRNWTRAVVKPATGEGTDATTTKPTTPISQSAPTDLTVGKQLVIKGTEVSFYIPPTGVEVVPETFHAEGVEKDRYVRDALTLERLEYAILVDENGKKRYERGPQVVFPLPSERFIEGRGDDGKSSKKFRAIELNEIQGVHLKVIAPYTEGGKEYTEGQELFITGKDTAIYFPREEHSSIKYDGKTKHFATAIPAGEARYVMDRTTGEIRTVKGPSMLLPDPRTEVIVRRVLTEKQVALWYPGNTEAAEYNRELRGLLATAPTTRQGAISEGDLERGARKSGNKQLLAAVSNAAPGLLADTSRVSGDQYLVGDEFSRGSSYTQPRTVTLDTKYQGAPSIDVWTSYAVMVVSKTGKRRVEKGPTTVLLDYDEGLEVLEMSTGKPKTTDTLLKQAYLLVDNNKVSDTISVETSDHVQLKIYLSHRVNFVGDSTKWFSVQNYVKLLCDHVRSILKGQVRKLTVEDFYRNSTDYIRDFVLGKATEATAATVASKRPGMKFEECGLQVIDTEVLQVELLDPNIKGLLDKAQLDVVRTNIELTTLNRNLDVARERDKIDRVTTEMQTDTAKLKDTHSIERSASQLVVAIAAVANKLREAEELQKTRHAEESLKDLAMDAQLARVKREKDQEFEFAQQEQTRQIEFLKAEAATAVSRFEACQGGFSEALLAINNSQTLVKVAEAWNLTRAIGGDSFAEAINKAFTGTPLQGFMQKITTAVPMQQNGSVGKSATPTS